MSKKLAIQGHEKRGGDVINILKMLGGTNYVAVSGINEEAYYFIDEEGIIDYDCTLNKNDNYLVFSLEEFLEKYPFKVGDVVFDVADGDIGTIAVMKWDEDVSDMKYRVDFNNGDIGWFTNDTIYFYLNKDNKEMNGNIETNQCKVNGLKRGDEYPIMEGVECNECIKYYFPDGYEFVDTDDTGVYLKPIKPKYPDNYEECVRIAKNIHGYDIHIDVPAYGELMESFVKLLICRDAYWKIAGEEMGLGKPWEPNWTTFEGMPAIFRFRYNIVCDYVKHQHCLLVFPTKEIRNIFYENFKNEIEQCKELL